MVSGALAPVLYLAAAAVLAVFLCSSVFYFGGSKVDESEIVLNAITIATGDWHPVWSPGYGHLAMYIPAALLGLAALVLQGAGIAASYTDGLYLLFADGAAYRIVRWVYALADVLTALLWAGIVWRAGRSRLLALACLAYFLVSPDSWQYANYVRSDTLVSLFVAIAVYLLVGTRGRWTPVWLGVALGAAIACKYSAATYLALIGFLLLPAPEGDLGLRRRVRMVATALATALVATFVFQPKFDYSGIIGAIDVHLSGSHFVRVAAPWGERIARLWQLVQALEPFAPACVLLAGLGLLRPRQALPAIAAAAIGIAPFALSQFPRDYWLIPFADALRGAAWVGVACVAHRLVRRGDARRWTIAAVVVATLFVVVQRAPALARTHRAPAQLSNADAARLWLYVHAANRKPVLYGYEKNFLLPRAYSFANYNDAADFSRVFIFHREGFSTLHALFRRELYRDEFAEFSAVTRVEAFRLAFPDAPAHPPPRMCAGSRCYPAKQVECDARSREVLGACTGYSWDMDRSVLRQDLSKLFLEIPTATQATLCWYTCGSPGAMRPVRLAQAGRIPLVDLAGALFAPAQVRSLTQIRAGRSQPQDSLIVTTPRAYKSWLPKNKRLGKGASADFARLMNARLVRYFDTGSGPVIEVYARQVRAKSPPIALQEQAPRAAAPTAPRR